MAENERKPLHVRALDYLIEKKCPPHELEGTYYLVAIRAGNRSWGQPDTTEMMGRRVHVCKICKGVFAE